MVVIIAAIIIKKIIYLSIQTEELYIDTHENSIYKFFYILLSSALNTSAVYDKRHIVSMEFR